jgi:hypothetical protein
MAHAERGWHPGGLHEAKEANEIAVSEAREQVQTKGKGAEAKRNKELRTICTGRMVESGARTRGEAPLR